MKIKATILLLLVSDVLVAGSESNRRVRTDVEAKFVETTSPRVLSATTHHNFGNISVSGSEGRSKALFYGLSATDDIRVSPASYGGLLFTATYGNPTNIILTAHNPSGAAVDPPNITFRVTVTQFE